MNPVIKKRLIRTLTLALVALMIGGGVGWFQIKNKKTEGKITSAVAGTPLGGPFTLTNQTGQTVTEKLFQGRYILMYFGFASCPAVCPTELQKISKALKQLEKTHPALAKNVLPVFVTVDPARDTPAVLKDYMSLYHPAFIGLTGTEKQITAMKKNYGVYAAKVTEKEGSDYSMDHSSYIYVLGPDGGLLGLYTAKDPAENISGDLAKAIKP